MLKPLNNPRLLNQVLTLDLNSYTVISLPCILKASKNQREQVYKLHSRIISWAHKKGVTDFERLAPRITAFTQMVGFPHDTVKILGSESQKNYIWGVEVNSRTYFLFYSKRGLSIESLNQNTIQETITDLKTMVKEFHL